MLGHDRRRLTWFTSRTLRAVREPDADCGDDQQGIRAGARSPDRDLLAIERPQSLRPRRLAR